MNRVTCSVATRWLAMVLAGATVAAFARPQGSASGSGDRPGERIGERIEDLAFTDLAGASGHLSDFADRAALVIVVRDPGCPVSIEQGPRTAELERQFLPQDVAFLYAELGGNVSADECRDEAARFGFAGRYLQDHSGRLGWHLRVRSTAEVFLLDSYRKLRYRGALDDRSGSAADAAATREVLPETLEQALEAVLAGSRVSTPATAASGRKLEFSESPPAEPPLPTISWHGEISRIVQVRCQGCHHPGGAGPFPLLDLDDLAGREAMVRQVVADRVMPPWYASDESGPFVNDLRLLPEERLLLLKWLQEECPAGDPALAPPPRTWPGRWTIPGPDVVFETSKPIPIPATGVLDYVPAESDFVAPEDLWVTAIQVLPRNPEVVHHLAAFVTDPNRSGRRWFEGYLPGKGPSYYPPGIGRLVRKGSKFELSIHYTPNGKACVDSISVGLVLAKEPPKYKVSGFYVRESKFQIPAGAKDYTIVADHHMSQESILFRFIPHMHLRGKSEKIEVIFPDGTIRVPLEIKRWNPDWQFAYVLKDPIPMPVGTVIRVTTVFDNSKDNPFNPDPTKIVRQGPQIWDEMAESYVEVLTPVRRRDLESDDESEDDEDK